MSTHSTINRKTTLVAAATAALALAAGASSAATITWDGGGGTLSWNDPANWNGDAKPAEADTVVFHDTGFGPDANYTVETGADQTVTVLRFGTTGASAQALTKNLTIAGNTITLLGNPTNNNAVNANNQATGTVTIGSNLVLATPNGIANFNRVGSTRLTVNGGISEAAGNPQSLYKTGGGTLALFGPLSYTGGTVVEAGTLLVNSSSGGGGPFSASGGTLGGTGAIAGPVTIADDGTLSPGGAGVNLIESLLAAGDVNLGGTLRVNVDGAGAGESDLLDVGGALTLGPAATLVLSEVNPIDDAAFVFARYSSLTGEFANVVGLPEGYSIDYAFGGNQIAVVAAPEPASLALPLVAAPSLLARRRRRRG